MLFKFFNSEVSYFSEIWVLFRKPQQYNNFSHNITVFFWKPTAFNSFQIEYHSAWPWDEERAIFGTITSGRCGEREMWILRGNVCCQPWTNEKKTLGSMQASQQLMWTTWGVNAEKRPETDHSGNDIIWQSTRNWAANLSLFYCFQHVVSASEEQRVWESNWNPEFENPIEISWPGPILDENFAQEKEKTKTTSQLQCYSGSLDGWSTLANDPVSFHHNFCGDVYGQHHRHIRRESLFLCIW